MLGVSKRRGTKRPDWQSNNGRDLNLIWNIEEKLRGRFIGDPSRAALEDIIAEHKFLDIHPNNRKFTWSNKRTSIHNIKERLDRILIQEDIAANFSSIKRKIVHASTSDHKPVVLILDKWENQGPIPFKYNKIWDSKDRFRNLIKQSWEEEVLGSPQYVWETKLKNVREKN